MGGRTAKPIQGQPCSLRLYAICPPFVKCFLQFYSPERTVVVLFFPSPIFGGCFFAEVSVFPPRDGGFVFPSRGGALRETPVFGFVSHKTGGRRGGMVAARGRFPRPGAFRVIVHVPRRAKSPALQCHGMGRPTRKPRGNGNRGGVKTPPYARGYGNHATIPATGGPRKARPGGIHAAPTHGGNVYDFAERLCRFVGRVFTPAADGVTGGRPFPRWPDAKKSLPRRAGS